MCYFYSLGKDGKTLSSRYRAEYFEAGFKEGWTDRNKDFTVKTFTILITTANGLLEKIHNIKKRMPVILDEEKEKKWLD